MNNQFEAFAVASAWGAHVTPQAGVEMLGRYWTTTSRESVKTRSIVRRPVAAFARIDRGHDGTELITMRAGRARVLDPLDPRSAVDDPFAASTVGLVAGRIALGHVDEVAGYGAMVREIPTPWSLAGRVLLSTATEESLVADDAGIATASGSWVTERSLPPIRRRARIAPVELDPDAPDEAHALATHAWTTDAADVNCSVGLTTPIGPVAVPGTWDADHGSAIVRHDVLARLAPIVGEGSCITLDRHADRRADEKVGMILRGLPTLRRLPQSHALADGHVGVVVDAVRVTWWYGFASGSRMVGHRAAA